VKIFVHIIIVSKMRKPILQAHHLLHKSKKRREVFADPYLEVFKLVMDILANNV